MKSHRLELPSDPWASKPGINLPASQSFDHDSVKIEVLHRRGEGGCGAAAGATGQHDSAFRPIDLRFNHPVKTHGKNDD
jgi:hypothetical protein